MRDQSKSGEVLKIARKAGIVRPRDLARQGIPSVYLRRLHRRGLLAQSGRGLYTLPGADLTANWSLAEAAKRVPHGVVCLLSALRFHVLTTQVPFEVWLALDRKARAPSSGSPPLRIVRMSGRALTAGAEEQRIEGVTVRLFNAAKTVADCFKYRNKIGLDVALEGLREAWRQRRATMDELWRYAQVCRVARVMRPYLESLA
jgi:predicted transcriptional regulator of viral defense system